MSTPIADPYKLLDPVSPSRPAGDDIRYLPAFDLVRALRQQAKTADTPTAWKTLAGQLEELLRTQSKDLFLAAWLVEAWTRLDRFRGVTAGLDVMSGIMNNFWESFYPNMDDTDAPLEPRMGVLEWLEGPFAAALGDVPITRQPAPEYSVSQADGHRQIGTHTDGPWPSASEVEEALVLSGNAALQELVESTDAALEALTRLSGVVVKHFRSEGPSSFPRVRDILNAARAFGLAGLRHTNERSAAPDVASSPTIVTATESAGTKDSEPSTTAYQQVPVLWAQAESMVAAGREAEALACWQDAIDRLPSGRGRFALRLALGEFCLSCHLLQVGWPILDLVCQEIDERRLSEWEEASWLSRAWSALYLTCDALKQSHEQAATRALTAYARLSQIDAGRAAAVAGARRPHPPVLESKSQ